MTYSDENEGAMVLNYHRNLSLNISNHPKFAHGLVTHVLHDMECIAFLDRSVVTTLILCIAPF